MLPALVAGRNPVVDHACSTFHQQIPPHDLRPFFPSAAALDLHDPLYSSFTDTRIFGWLRPIVSESPAHSPLLLPHVKDSHPPNPICAIALCAVHCRTSNQNIPTTPQ
jgi:hypothetical protein